MKKQILFFALAGVCLSSLFFTSCNKDSIQKTVVSGSNDLTTVLAQFRSLAGDSLNSTPTPAFLDGRRKSTGMLFRFPFPTRTVSPVIFLIQQTVLHPTAESAVLYSPQPVPVSG
ncbi:MAG: hypothetical protein IPM95_01125 [Sphingobacteriales bacterium]|nr:hypothetical protein [Sphingobacteriales bacterium]